MLAERDSSGVTAAFGVARSFTSRTWTLRGGDSETARGFARDHSISATLAQILVARGIADAEIADTLYPTLKKMLPEPLSLKDMDKAVARARQAIENGEKIAVFGDYDVDGSSSAALMSEFLTALGKPPRIYIPDRMTEGYGPNAPAMRKLKDEGASLVITVDCGAGAVAALTAARDAGLDVVVLDHHAVEIPPPAFAHVNPNQPGDTSGLTYVCAAGVTFLFLVALNRALRDAGWYGANGIAEPKLMDSLDLVGLATVCDVVPLIGVNRAFVRAGLGKLSTLSRPGFAQLAAVAKSEPPFTPYSLGFLFGPRINAGGRVGRCSLGVELLTAKTSAEALPLAQMLDRHNKERQALEGIILESAVALAAQQDNAPFILVGEEGWHPGVVGIVASRLKDRFGKPALVAGFEGGMGRGSARSVQGIDIGAAVRAAYEAGILETGGGHAMAAGFSLTAGKLDAFREFLAAQFAKGDGALTAAQTLDVDVLISPSGATVSLLEEIALAGPYGAGNEEPLVAVADARIAFADIVGKDHVRVRLVGADGGRLDAISFRTATTPLGQGLLGARGKRVHAVGKLRKDEWNGQVRVQLHLEDAAAAEV